MFSNLFESISLLAHNLKFQDFIDMFLVWVVIYQALLLVSRSGAAQMLTGLGVLAVAYAASITIELHTLNWLLEKFFTHLFVIVVILFQREIRQVLAHIGSNPFFTEVDKGQETHIIEEICKGANLLSQKGIGALLVLEREINTDYHVEEGRVIDSKVTAELLLSIFQINSPLHDGAVLIRQGRLHSAGCFLPLSKNPNLDKNMGTRHRAAIGLTDETDAVVIVVSEELRNISLAQGGNFNSGIEATELRKTLYELFDIKFRGDRSGDRENRGKSES